MRTSTRVWSEALLARFVTDPAQVVPGTKMRFSGFGYDDRKVADLAACLRQSGVSP